MSEERLLSGGCLCGTVRYEIRITNETATLCHCAMCRRQSGGAFMGFVTVPRSRYRLLNGTLSYYRSSRIGRRGFCATCGTPLVMDYDFEPDRTGVVTGSLDDAAAVPPALHWGVESLLPWLKLDDGLPRKTTEEDPEFVEAVARLDGGP